MAVHALQPAPAPANASHARFNAAMRHYAQEAARQAGLPASRSMAPDLAAAEAVEGALARLIATPAPDVRALGQKLHVTLRAAGTTPELRGAIEADVRRLVAGEARA